VAISFPTSLDNFSNPASTDSLNTPSHSLQHTDINDAVEAMQRKVGVGSAVAGSATAGQVLTISAAGTSTWSTPTTPGLVQVVPTSVAVGSGSGSVDANGAVTFTGASSVSLNDVFSATYNNYKVDINITSASTNNADTLRLRVAGTDNSTSNYNYAGIFLRTSASSIVYGNTSQTSFGDILPHSTNGNEAFSLNIYSPFVAERTKYNAGGIGQDVTSIATQFQAGVFAATTSFTGFTFISGSGTFTGRIRVYGLAN